MEDSKDHFVEYVVHNIRKLLIKKHTPYGYNLNDVNINDINFTDDCGFTVFNTRKLCEQNNIENYIVSIDPGYTSRTKLYCGKGFKFHIATIIHYHDSFYLIDVTYPQFFQANQNNLDRLGIINMSNCSPGTFVLMDDFRKNIAITLIQNGYIKLNEEILKAYLDPFTISFRNGLYYEETNDFSYTTTYSANDYIHFLEETDNQINHEGRDFLGYQKRPLKQWNLNFSKQQNPSYHV